MKNNRPWFGPRSGFGSRPRAYQGWIVVLAYVSLALLSLVNVKPFWLAIGIVVILTIVEGIIELKRGGTFGGGYFK